MLSMTEARERVARGAARLDMLKPGWYNRIDVGTLTLHDGCGCVIGQLAGGRFRPTEVAGIADNDAIVACGFDLTEEELAEPNYLGKTAAEIKAERAKIYSPLQDAWIEAIADRRLPTTEQRHVDYMVLST